MKPCNGYEKAAPLHEQERDRISSIANRLRLHNDPVYREHTAPFHEPASVPEQAMAIRRISCIVPAADPSP
jgi:hypothetical protein